jgi:biotin carboxyl carrier protein
MRYVTTIEGKDYQIEILDENHIVVDGELYNVDFNSINDQPVYSLLIDGKSIEAYVYPILDSWQVLLQGHSYPAQVVDEREKSLRAAAGSSVSEREEYHLKAPMPGLVVAIPVDVGQQVERGEVLLVLESMKMQNELRTPRSGKVTRLRVKPGDSVEQNQTMLSVV